MSTREFIISCPIEKVHWGRKGSHYRCVLQGLQLQRPGLNTNPAPAAFMCKTVIYVSVIVRLRERERKKEKHRNADSFQSFSSSFLFLLRTEKQVGHARGFRASLNSTSPGTRARFKKPGVAISALAFPLETYTPPPPPFPQSPKTL